MTTTRPTIILSLGRPRLLPVGAIAIDLKNNCFWRGVRRRPKLQQTGRPTYKSAPFRLLALLVIRSPGTVALSEIAGFLWADDPQGGPDNIQNYVAKRIDIARNGDYRIIGRSNETILSWLGAEIITYYRSGFSLQFTAKAELQADPTKITGQIAEKQV